MKIETIKLALLTCKFVFADVVIGFSNDEYEGREENPNRPCRVTVDVNASTEILLQIQLTPSPGNATSKNNLPYINMVKECMEGNFIQLFGYIHNSWRKGN